ncbi:hypothetical protein D3C75_1293460 [compost metagenome]
MRVLINAMIVTAIPIPGEFRGCGEYRCWKPVKNRNRAEPEINMLCASAASDSALPWPKVCSSSAGCNE